MTEQSVAPGSNPQQAPPPRPPARRGLQALIVALVGGALTAGALVLVSANNSNEAASDLSIVAVTDIGAAAQTMDPAAAAELATGARNCSVPLARVTIAKLPTSSGGTVRIRSGSYLSPPFQLTDVPQQVAIPFPGPYPVGAGTLGVEGNATGVVISLRPGWTVPTLDGAAVRNVTWRVGSPCQ
jgi:hypothetical protein